MCSEEETNALRHVVYITMADGEKHKIVCFGEPVIHDNWIICQVDESGVKSRAFNINYIAYLNIQKFEDPLPS